jgi:hypothetical protein
MFLLMIGIVLPPYQVILYCLNPVVLPSRGAVNVAVNTTLYKHMKLILTC